MAQYVLSLLEDLGVYGAAPTTFIDLFVWAVTSSAIIAFVLGLIGVFFWACSNIGKRRRF